MPPPESPPTPFRLIHTSDWHLGHELHGFDRGVEHDAFLTWLVARLAGQRADALLVTGDIYDTVNPPVPAQLRLFRFLAAALAAVPHLHIVLTGGNHDSAARVELPRDLLDPRRVTLVGGLPRAAAQADPARACVTLRDAAGTARAVCAAVPYLRPGDLAEGGVAAIYRQAAAAADAVRGALPLIVTGHLTVSGGEVSALSERRILMGGEEAVSADIFPAHACYVALGHLHRPQRIGATGRIRYAGSPFPLSVTERDYAHSIVVLDIDPAGAATHRLEPIPRAVPFLRIPDRGAAALEEIEALLRALPAAADAAGPHPYLELAVTQSGPQPDLRRRVDVALEGRAARLLTIRPVAPAPPPGTAGAPAAPPRALGEMDPAEIFRRRHADMHNGTAPSAELEAAFATLLAETLAPPDPVPAREAVA